MRAYTVAMQPPAASILFIPLDDWDQPALGEAVVRTASSRCSPDPERLTHFAERIRKSKNPVLLYGPEIERAGGWDAGIKFAERLRAPVYMTPLSDKASFPQTHPQFRGMVPFAIGALGRSFAAMTSSSWLEPRSSGITPTLQETTFPKVLNSCKSQMIPTMRPPLSLETACWQTQSWPWRH
jgi:benzoylformate decarboxylase